MAEPIQIGILLYPNVTQLDATGPAQVLSRVPGAKLHMIWKTLDPVPTDAGFSIVPTTTFADCPRLDVICVPGGGGQTVLMTDDETLDFLRKQAATARYVTSVCTGSLVLGDGNGAERRQHVAPGPVTGRLVALQESGGAQHQRAGADRGDVARGGGLLAQEVERFVVGHQHRLAAAARYVTSVCTGSLVLGAAGLLKGYKSACHWAWRDMLPAFGAIPVAERVVRDRNRISGGGVTAGIDFGLTVAAELAGEEAAKSIQLVLEYDPQPPFDSGSPEKAGVERVKRIRERMSGMLQNRQKANDDAAAKLA